MKLLVFFFVTTLLTGQGTVGQGSITQPSSGPPTYAQAGGTGSPNNQPCISGYKVVVDGTSSQNPIYTCGGGGTANVYGIAPTGAASSVPASGVTSVGGAVQPGSSNLANSTLHYRPNVVDDFGADPTGVADSSSHFQTAVTTAVSLGGSQIYVPCGTYKLTSTAGNPAFYSHSPAVSMVGPSQNCVTLNYIGSGRAVDWFTQPFTINPSNEFGHINIVGTSSGQVGLYTGQANALHIHDVFVSGFTSGIGIELIGDGNNPPSGSTSPAGSFNEDLILYNVTARNNLHGIDLENINGNTHNSFAYSDYSAIHIGADEGQIGFYIGTGVQFANNNLRINCNLTAYNSGTTGPVCVYNNGQVHSDFIDVEGEYDSGAGSGTPYAYVIGTQGLTDSYGPGFHVAGSGFQNNNPTGYPNRIGDDLNQVWDIGTMTINGNVGQPSATFLGGTNGALASGNFLSIYNQTGNVGTALASCSASTGNKFEVLAGTINGSLSGANNLFEVDCDTGSAISHYLMQTPTLFLGPASSPSSTTGFSNFNYSNIASNNGSISTGWIWYSSGTWGEGFGYDTATGKYLSMRFADTSIGATADCSLSSATGTPTCNSLLTGTQQIFRVGVTAPGYTETLTTPASSSATCTAGQFTDDANYHYVCTATNTWKRVALTSF